MSYLQLCIYLSYLLILSVLFRYVFFLLSCHGEQCCTHCKYTTTHSRIIGRGRNRTGSGNFIQYSFISIITLHIEVIIFAILRLACASYYSVKDSLSQNIRGQTDPGTINDANVSIIGINYILVVLCL